MPPVGAVVLDLDDTLDAVAALHARGLVTAVLTNGTETQQRAKLQRIGLLERVDPVFTAEALGVAKPSPRAFAMVCAALDGAGQRAARGGRPRPGYRRGP